MNDYDDHGRLRSWDEGPEKCPALPEERMSNLTRAALLWVLWNHQGAGSSIGQPIRALLNKTQHERLGPDEVRIARDFGTRLTAHGLVHGGLAPEYNS
jgi:acyl-coenzyme A thioesterase PaaI-like protein